jgi:16S rRNA (cytosine967-C5)-methyltransferase
MTVNARQVALEMVGNILDQGAYANLEAYRDLNRAGISEADKRFALEITYGTTKHWNTLDWVLGEFMSRPMERVEPYVRNVLRTGAYQLLYLDRVPASAACDEVVKLVKKRHHQGIAGFVNGVLRSITRKYNSIEDVEFPDIDRHPIEHIALRYSFPPWMVNRWVSNFGFENTLEICRYSNTPPVLTVRVNTLKTSVEEFTGLLEQKDINWLLGSLCPESIIIKDYGKLEKDKEIHRLYLTQSEPSMLVSHVLRPEGGMSVLDACSAPGSKTTHLAQLMDDQGKILAVDIHEHRLRLVKSNCSRLGIKTVETLLSDAREIAHKTDAQFDCVLVDAPCSGTGVLNRRADARWRRKPEDISAMSCLQKEIMEAVIPLVKPGGRLVYSTCSLEPEENNVVLDNILKKHPELVPDPFGQAYAQLGFHKDDFAVQLTPHTHHTDGFYISRLKRLAK